VTNLQQRLGISERRACRTIGQPRSTQRKLHLVRDDEAALSAAIIRLASAYGRYGYRRITRCYAPTAGGSMLSECSASGGVRGSRYRRDNRNGAAYGSMMGRAFDSGPHIPIMCGPTTLWPIGQWREDP
jgi:hypothetical protein